MSCGNVWSGMDLGSFPHLFYFYFGVGSPLKSDPYPSIKPGQETRGSFGAGGALFFPLFSPREPASKALGEFGQFNVGAGGI